MSNHHCSISSSMVLVAILALARVSTDDEVEKEHACAFAIAQESLNFIIG